MTKDTKDGIASYLSRVMSSDGSKLPKNRVKVRIAGEDFTIVAAESDEYIRRVAAYVDSKISVVTMNSRIPLLDAAILASCNIADEQIKAMETAENLRVQIKGYIDDIGRLRTELNEARRELSRNNKS